MMATATSAQIAVKLRPHHDTRQRLDERVPKLASEVRELRERLIEASVAAATVPTANGEEREVAEIERALAKAERELEAAQREREMATRTIAGLEAQFARVQRDEILVDARREHRADFALMCEALATAADCVRRDEERRREAERAGISATEAFGLPFAARDLLDAIRESLTRAAVGKDIERGDVQFVGDPLIVWRPKGARR